jgi:hypothetical protein
LALLSTKLPWDLAQTKWASILNPVLSLLGSGTDQQVLIGGSFPKFQTIYINGTYTPILTNISNTTALISNITQFYQIGKMVTVFGSISYNTLGANHSLTMTLPILPSVFTETYQAGGAANKLTGLGPQISSTVNSTTITISSSTDVGNGIMPFQFSYRL